MWPIGHKYSQIKVVRKKAPKSFHLLQSSSRDGGRRKFTGLLDISLAGGGNLTLKKGSLGLISQGFWVQVRVHPQESPWGQKEADNGCPGTLIIRGLIYQILWICALGVSWHFALQVETAVAYLSGVIFLNKYSIFIQLGLEKPWLQSPSELQRRAKSLCLRFQETIQLSLQSPWLSEAGLLLLFSLPLLFCN